METIVVHPDTHPEIYELNLGLDLDHDMIMVNRNAGTISKYPEDEIKLIFPRDHPIWDSIS